MLLFSTFVSVPSAATGNVVDIGICVTDHDLDYAEYARGDTFTVNIVTPVFPANADGVELRVYYDSAAVELVDSTWTPGFGNFTDLAKFKAQAVGANKDAGGSFFAFAASSAKSDDIPVNGGFRLSTRLRIKPNARVSSTDLFLTTYSVAYNEADGVTQHEMWANTVPSTNTKATIAITGTPHVNPVTGGGISVDKHILDRGDTLNVNVAVPAIAWDADDPYLTVSYDPTVFDLVTWNPAKGSKMTTLPAGQFGVRFSNANLDLDDPLNLTAVLKVKDTAAKSDCTFTLTPNINEGLNTLWIPDTVTADVSVTGLPVIGGGMTVSPTGIKRGEKVTATITVPPINEIADHAEIQIGFNKDAFKVTKWEPAINGASYDNNTGKIIINANEAIDMSGGFTFTAELTANDNVDLGIFYPFTLEKAAFTRTEVGRKQTIWLPSETMKYAEVEVYGNLPVTGKGLTVSSASLDLGDEFKVTVTVPPINAKVDAAELEVKYDPEMFEITNITTDSAALTINSNTTTGTFGVSGTDLYPKLDLSGGLTLTADMKVKYTAKKGTYSFDLNKSSLTYKRADGTPVSVWTPLTKNAKVTIKRDDTDFPVRSDGITVSSSRVKPDGTFTATVKVPALRATGETFSANVVFDHNVFEVQSVTSSNNKITTAYNDGYFSADATTPDIDLTKGITITARMKVRSYAALGRHDLTLISSELTGCVGGGAPSQNLWIPLQTVASVTVPSPEDDYPVSGGGLSLSQSSIYAGDQFTLYVKIPVIDIVADNVSYTVDFDGNNFEVVSWDPHLTNGVPTYSTGSIGLNAAGGTGINLRNGITFSATLKAKTNANPSQYQFRLTRTSVTSYSVSKELWTPVSTTVPLTVLSSNNNNNGYDPTKWNQWDPWNQWKYIDPWNNWNRYNPYNPYNKTPSNNNGKNNRDDFVYDPDDDDRDEIPVNDRDDEIGNRSNGNINIELNGDLKNVANKGIKVKTKKKFFYGDTVIIIRNTDIADMSAASALKQLNMSNCQSYAFDVSVYDSATGKYIHTIDGGYIDISIPVPTVFTGSPDRIAVYHIDDGNPEFLNSELVYENGIQKIKYRASSFSPYMFVDPTSTKSGSNSGSGSNYTVIPNSNTGGDDYYYPGGIAGNGGNGGNGGGNGGNGGGNGGNGGSNGGGNVRPANPNTGSTVALIVIPAATLGCVLLAKKGKRKRSSRRK